MSDQAVLFPTIDPVGPWRDGAADLAHVIARLVAPYAAATDVAGVPRATIDALAAAGLLGPERPAVEQREVAELLAGSDATTWFCWVQHQTPTRVLDGAVAGLLTPAAPSLTQNMLPALRSGERLAAVAFAHLRRPGPPNPVATRVDGGWRLDGSLDWVTSWDIADVVLVMAQCADDDRIVCCYLPAGRAGALLPGMHVGEVLPLLSMGGTHTRPLQLESVVVDDEHVGAVLDRSAYLAADELRTCDANPSAFGVTRGAVAELAVVAEQRADARMAELASMLVDECRAVRAQAYEAADAGASAHVRVELRARSLDLVMRATTSVVVARAGGAMLQPSSAERRVREALFLQVQAQTARTRAAQLELGARHLDLLGG
jgi:alkylation response protein AidB-like acyl-CoA dehydrogenase